MNKVVGHLEVEVSYEYGQYVLAFGGHAIPFNTYEEMKHYFYSVMQIELDEVVTPKFN